MDRPRDGFSAMISFMMDIIYEAEAHPQVCRVNDLQDQKTGSLYKGRFIISPLISAGYIELSFRMHPNIGSYVALTCTNSMFLRIIQRKILNSLGCRDLYF